MTAGFVMRPRILECTETPAFTLCRKTVTRARGPALRHAHALDAGELSVQPHRTCRVMPQLHSAIVFSSRRGVPVTFLILQFSRPYVGSWDVG